MSPSRAAYEIAGNYTRRLYLCTNLQAQSLARIETGGNERACRRHQRCQLEKTETSVRRRLVRSSLLYPVM
jgi:hypothetical protein